MQKLSRRQFLLSSAALAALASVNASAREKAAERTGLKDAFKGDFLIGTAISNRTLEENDEQLKSLIAREFNAITAENCMKSALLQPRQGQWRWDLADRFVDFGSRNRMAIVGHALVWHSQVPDDFFVRQNGEKISREELIQRMETHIHTVVGRYGDRVRYWDVVNEAIDDEKGWRKSDWFKVMGSEEYLEHAFRLTHELAPQAQLLYNDYNMHLPGKREFLVDVIRDYKRRGVPIHGIGMQSHVGLSYPDLQQYEASLKAYADEGMRIHITELEVDVLPVAWEHMGAEISTNFEYSDQLNPWPNGLPASVEQQLTERYVEMFELFLKYRDSIDRVTTWGTHDGESWKNDFPVRGRSNYPLLFDRKQKPRPAYFAVSELRFKNT